MINSLFPELAMGNCILVKPKDMGNCWFGKSEQVVEGDDGQQFLPISARLHTLDVKMCFRSYMCLLYLFPGEHRVKVFSYSELRKATQDFSGANKIGEGGFGSVYRVNTYNFVRVLCLTL